VEIAKALRPTLVPDAPPKRYLIVVAVRNAEKYIGACLESIMQQTRPLLCAIVDDGSDDNTFSIAVRAVAQGGGRFHARTHGGRRYSLCNIADAIRKHGQPGDVVVVVDGDDKLKPGALDLLDTVYAVGAWMTYGNFVTSEGQANWMPPYPWRVVEANSFRTHPWAASHPKTFKKELFDKIDQADFQHDGEWFKTAGDVALMMPMLEMAGERAVYVPQVLYEYTEDNPLGDHRVDPQGQVRVRNLILAKKPYTRLEKL
jgi:glycosyltransferase involved in cell wall biosynthesis